MRADKNVLHYSRELVVKELVLKPDQYGALKKVEAIIVMDETRGAVLTRE